MPEPKEICLLLARLLAEQEGQEIKSITVQKGDE